MSGRTLVVAVLALTAGALASCGGAPPRTPEQAYGTGNADLPQGGAGTPSLRALAAAAAVVGTPYRYGGDSPAGFDCSGLVYYAYLQAGKRPPRTTTEQYRLTRRVPVSGLRPGDLVFFTIDGPKVSHVGIYAGDGRFIHAASSGKSVAYASLANPYWRERLTGAGRLQ